MSRPAWDAWIEMCYCRYLPIFADGRVPHGTRGLKCWQLELLCQLSASRPAWDAWIEMSYSNALSTRSSPSRPAWDAWIEIAKILQIMNLLESRPAWDAWIEIRTNR